MYVHIIHVRDFQISIPTSAKNFSGNVHIRRSGRSYKLFLSIPFFYFLGAGVKPWKCEECGKAFLNKDSYNSHLRRHRGERPFACDVCKKAFTELWALKKHLRYVWNR